MEISKCGDSVVATCICTCIWLNVTQLKLADQHPQESQCCLGVSAHNRCIVNKLVHSALLALSHLSVNTFWTNIWRYSILSKKLQGNSDIG